MTPEDRITDAFNGWIQDAVICGKGQADAMDLRRNLAGAIRAAMVEEREACAKEAELHARSDETTFSVCQTVADAIRARGAP